MNSNVFVDLSVQKNCTYTVAENSQMYLGLTCINQVNKNIICTFILEKNATLRVEFLLSDTDATVTVECIMQEEGSCAEIYGVYVMRNNQSLAINTYQNHRAAHTTSKVCVRGVLYDDAQCAYKGLIRAEKMGTHAVQENKNIVASKNARVVSIPQLEVTTADVTCFHASATGRFDKQELFYISTRGIDIKQAEHLLLHGFFAGMFEKKEMNEYMQEAL